jgi:hypothetical protein
MTAASHPGRPRLATPAMALTLGGLTLTLGAAYWVLTVLWAAGGRR